MANVKNLESVLKLQSRLLGSKRKIIGLDINSNKGYEPYKINKTVATIDYFKEIQQKCPAEWNNCTNEEICNKVIGISQKFTAKINVSQEERDFINKNNKDKTFLIILDCVNKFKELEEKEQQKANQQAENAIKNINNQNLIQGISNFSVIFSDNSEYLEFASKHKFKLVEIIETGEIVSLKQLLDNGMTSLTIQDENYDTNSKIIIQGGIYDSNTFFNRKTFIRLFSNYDNYLSKEYPYYEENSFNILGTDEYITLSEIFSSGSTGFTLPTSENWTSEDVFEIIDGDYNGKLIKNKIYELIEKNFLCNYFVKIPFLGRYICGKTDYSLYFLTFIIILFLVIIFFIFRKKPKPVKKNLTPDQKLAIKKAKVLQMEFKE